VNIHGREIDQFSRAILEEMKKLITVFIIATTAPYTGQIIRTLLDALTYYFFQNQFNIAFPFTSSSLKWSLAFRF
jgi:hypothetical protein